jgi:uncharacterized protein (DUF488 family)
MKVTAKLFTIGYEGATPEELIQTLKKNHVQCVVDLRKNPISRKRGFSKRLLGESLHAKKIEYMHLPGLGTPTEWRKSEKAGLITREKMFRDYVKKVIPQHPEDLETLRKQMHRQNVAILCYEADATDCHRSFVAKELAAQEKQKLEIINLEIHPDENGMQLFKTPKARVLKGKGLKEAQKRM